ncbi:MAG: endopeptidase La [Gemmatimonadetes bacterium]|nr:endopeptidase La [Gemmatimonadota bacterium]
MADPTEDTDELALPERLPVLALPGVVLFPHVVLPLAIEIPEQIALVDEVLQGDKLLALAALKPDRAADEPQGGDAPFHASGTLAQIVRMMKLPDDSVRMLVQGRSRLHLDQPVKRGDFWIAEVREIPITAAEGVRIEALRRSVSELFREIVGLSPALPDEVGPLVDALDDPAKLADFVAANVAFDVEAKQELLAEGDVARRLERVTELLGKELEILQARADIQNRVQERMGKSQREYVLREQMREIQDELGEGQGGEAAQLRAELEAAEMTDEARAQAEKELARLERMGSQSAEYGVVRTYIDTLLSLPWKKESEAEVNLPDAREILDRDHYGLEKIKERIIEYLAVRKLNPHVQGPILCFVGPPGVGKTSLGRSVAEAMGRVFARISLGGVRDEAEIRGHRRTYVGAMPGRIIQAMRTAEVRNPVFMLDEIDKIGQDFRGDPTSALLEVLDPAQNDTFVDHYLEIPFDLSATVFIATANSLATIPEPLLDRMEVLHLSAYAPGEKLEVARRYLVPKQMAEHGLQGEQVEITEDALVRLIAEYTREAGVRNLERAVGGLLRKAAVQVVEGRTDSIRITAETLPDYAGPPRFRSEIAGREEEVGVATGLAYTPVGGEILFIEAVRMPGRGRISLTGQLGDVMKESARAAFSYLRASGDVLDIDREVFTSTDVHLHVPAGATPKDGPSAGVAMTVALASLLSGRPVRPEIAMTGEITLRGHVLPVGGIREKVIAAERAGIQTVLLPARNEPDVEDIPQEVRDHLEIQFIEHASEAFDRALIEEPVLAGAVP